MTVIRLELIVRPLPEIGVAIRLDAQTVPGGVDRPAGWFTVPAELRMQTDASELFVDSTLQHGNPPGVYIPCPYKVMFIRCITASKRGSERNGSKAGSTRISLNHWE